MGSWEDTLGKYYSPGMPSGPDCNEFPGSSESVSPQQWKGVLKKVRDSDCTFSVCSFSWRTHYSPDTGFHWLSGDAVPMKGPSLFLLCRRNMLRQA